MDNTSNLLPSEHSQKETVRESARERTMTEKGLEYKRYLLERDRDSALRSWRRQFETSKQLLSTSKDATALRRELVKLETRMDDLSDATGSLKEAQNPEEKSKTIEDYGAVLSENVELSKRLRDKITDLESEMDDRLSVSTKHSRRSKSSRKSSVYSNSSIPKKAEMITKAARLGAELRFHDIESEKVATLKRQEDDIKKLQIMKELAATTAEIDAVTRIEEEEYGVSINKTNNLELPEDDAYERIDEYLKTQADPQTSGRSPEAIASTENTVLTSGFGANAQTNVTSMMTSEAISTPTTSALIAVTGAGSIPSTPIHVPGAETKVTFTTEPEVTEVLHHSSTTALNPAAPPFTAKTSLTQTFPTPSSVPQDSFNMNANTPDPPGVEGVIVKLADLLTQRQDRDSLPRPEPEVFDGDLLRYPIWIKSFETFIERKTKDPSERLYYLGKFTRGEAKEAVNGLLPLDTKEAYTEAKRLLASRFGSPFLVSNAYRKKINDWPKIFPNDGPGLRRFSDFLQHCNTAMHSVKYLGVLNDPEENQKMLKKLPNHLVSRWSRIVDKRISGEETYEQRLDDAASTAPCHAGEYIYPSFSEFCSFLKTEARIACNPVTSLRATRDEDLKGRTHGGYPRSKNPAIKSLATGAKEADGRRESNKAEKRIRETSCLFCKASHDLTACEKFLQIPLTDRRSFVIAKRLCWGCLRWGHQNRDCRRKKSCKTCSGPHPSVLHDETWKGPLKEEAPNQDNHELEKDTSVSHRTDVYDVEGSDQCTSHTLIVPVWLHHQSNPQDKIRVYALLDEQSDACFVTESAINSLGVDGPDTRLELSTVLACKTITSKKITGLTIRGVNEATDIPLPKTYTRNVIPARHSQIPRPETARKWPHLEGIARHLMPLDTDVEVGLLIGANCARAIKPHKVILGKDNDPYAKKTALGWGIVGVVDTPRQHDIADDVTDDVVCNRIVVREVQTGTERRTCHFALKTQVKEVINPLQVAKMFTLDFNDGRTEEKCLSFEDRRFLKIVREGIHQRNDGHYEMPLPFKYDTVNLPNNREMALSRLMKLKRRLQSDTQYREDYVAFMEDIIQKGFAERVTEPPENNKLAWYIPHHGVYNKKKPGKIRVVFDCSAPCYGQSLNQQLLQGPDLTNNLTGVLYRFRKEQIAFMCDIQGMFHQVNVDACHRDYLRFLWWKDSNFESAPSDFRMTVHLFGATSSPGCANFALKTTAEQYEDTCGSEAADFIRKDFYVDDGLKSVASIDQAKDLIENTKSLCQKGGFRLHKFTSNSQDVISSIPAEDRGTETKNPSLLKNTAIERALGVHWCVESDTLQFRIELKDKPLSRRAILSTVSSIYDPLGLIAPFILTGKRILQELCRSGVSWDDELPEEIRPRWEKWRTELPLLERLKIPRCYKPDNFGEVRTVELHHFSDASQSGYGQCSYLRLTDGKGRIQCSLVMGKSRVTPLKPITVPRLELTAALVAAKVGLTVKKELEYEQVDETYWTDSKTVLGYINNDARRFHVFVANRVQEIRENTSPKQWHYIPTKENPADIASRGSGAQALIDSSLWWNGPKFLWTCSKDWNLDDFSTVINPGDPEVKRVSVLTTLIHHSWSLQERLAYFSSWYRAKKAVAVCLRLQKKFRNEANKRKNTTSQYPSDPKSVKYVPVSVEELQNAETEIIKNLQGEEFGEEIRSLRTASSTKQTNDVGIDAPLKRQMKKTSSLYRLNPFLDDKGVLRVGGRIRHAVSLTFDAKHPIILPRKGHITELIVCHHHHLVEHQGHGMTRNEIRSAGFWIIGGGSAVTNHISKCVKCRKLRAAPEEQKMADLPEDRLEPAPPFTFSAVDCFGPWYIKEGRRELKRYGVLFTCLSSRAIHIEVSNTLTTDSFINAYRRFVGRRGPIRQLRSDQGSNFVGGMNELRQALHELNHDKIREELLMSSCDWVQFRMNVPHASHMGGVWERQIRTARNVLESLLERHGGQLDDESLRTLMVEAEAIVNCRPLSVHNMNSWQCPDPLTPNHLLTAKSKVVMPPPGEFQRADLYLSKRWRRVQHLANEFWCRWKKEFLQSLQLRQKWVPVKRNLQVDDIVIVVDENLPRNRWKLARVHETFPGKDGLVRKARVVVAADSLDGKGQRTKPPVYLERPVKKLVLLLPSNEVVDRGIPPEEP